MFDIGFSELLVISAVALVVLGPEQLPGVMLKLGRFVGTAKRQMQKWQAELEDAALDAEIREHNERITKSLQNDKAEPSKLDPAGVYPGEGRGRDGNHE